MRSARSAATTVLSATLLILPAFAADLGTLGPSYPIAEPHLLQMIEDRLREKQRSGASAELERQAIARASDAVGQPAPVQGLRTTTEARSFLLDPSVTLQHNILGPQGELLLAAGTKANPLDVVPLRRRLLFLDARDPRQVRQARALMAQDPNEFKPILTAGSYMDLMRIWQIPVYYDQAGLLTRRLGIVQVPALVSQEGPRLRIDELEVSP